MPFLTPDGKRRAEWRPVVGEPTTIFGWVPHVLVETPTLVLLSAFMLAGIGWAIHIPHLIGGAIAAVAVGTLLPYRSPRPNDDLPTLPLPKGSYPVGVTVRIKGLALGTDDAIASFVEGWLHVEGRRASFSVRATDVRARISLSDGSIVIDLPKKQSVRLEPALLAPEFRSLALGTRNAVHGELDGFRQATKEWIAARSTPVGTAILPPRRVHPAAYARKLVRAAILIATGVTAILALLHEPVFPATPFLVLALWIFVQLAVLITVASWGVLRQVDALPLTDVEASSPHPR